MTATTTDPTAALDAEDESSARLTTPADEAISTRMAANGGTAAPSAADVGSAPEPAVEEAETAGPGWPFPIGRRPVYGSYRGSLGTWVLDLRVDVDGARTTRRVSGDFFSTSGSTTSYFGSFVVDSPTITTSGSTLTVEGTGRFTWAAMAPLIRVTIPRVPRFVPPRPATVEFIRPPSSPGATYVCGYGSPYFRTVSWEQDSVAGAVPFVSYDTGSLPLPPSGTARALTVPRCYADAGIQLLAAGQPNVVPISDAGWGPSPSWSDSELHAAMVNHFSLFADISRWQVWLLVATRHDGGYRGIMFDYADGFQRQGCAVFHDAIGGADPVSQRAALRTYVHELGHAFNLLHSWDKALATPPAPLGPNQGFGDLSWMNYPQNYNPGGNPPGPAGTDAYWAAFDFRFTDDELVHLRHGFYRDVIMGGNPFGTGAGDVDPDLFDRPIVDNSGLALELRTPKPSFGYGEPVVVELKLEGAGARGRSTHGYLHPNDGMVAIAIRQPSGRTVVHRPLLQHCVDRERRIMLDHDRPAIYDSAYVGFGRDGFQFEQPGRYAMRARYLADDGSVVVSPVLHLRVRHPVGEQDEQVGELMLGDQQGQLLALLGSDSPALGAGRAGLEQVRTEFPDHPLAVYADLVTGVNAARDFKILHADGTPGLRPAEPKAAVELLGKVERVSAGDGGVDNITLNAAMRTAAVAAGKAGDVGGANAIVDRMVATFDEKTPREHVRRTIRLQAERTRRLIAEEADEVRGPDRSGEPKPRRS